MARHFSTDAGKHNPIIIKPSSKPSAKPSSKMAFKSAHKPAVSAKNPQSGASLSSSSRGSQSSSDPLAVSIDLKADLADLKPGNANEPKLTYPANRPSRGVTNLILLLENGDWNAAANRALTHPQEVRQLVKLRKTTKGSGGLQISNVKCKALHHACQKLRSVHGSIYQKKKGGTALETGPPVGASVGNSAGNSAGNSTGAPCNQRTRREVIEEDEYIEACKCILTLIKVHPEACKERESRHGCLPLHLAVFSMCNTPPPPRNARSASDSRCAFGARLTSSKHASHSPHTSRGHKGASLSTSSAEFSTMTAMMNEESQAVDREEDPWASRLDDMEMILATLEKEMEKKHRRNKSENSTASDNDASNDSNNNSNNNSNNTSNNTSNHDPTIMGSNNSEATEASTEVEHSDTEQDSFHDLLTPTTARLLPTHEELQRRYLQINTQRREEFSVRVIDALLDAWPRGVKTASEGGRLPLHMACFGKATVRVIETVLNAYPDAARHRNADGFLPIHIAAHWGVSHPDIAPLILRAYPDGAVGRNRWERTPIEEALGMAGENGREHQMALVWALRRHPTYWIHNDIGAMLLPRNVRSAPWRIVDRDLPVKKDRGGAVDVDEVSSFDDSDEEDLTPQPSRQTAARLARATDLSHLLTLQHWDAAALRLQSHPHEARESLEVKVRGAYAAKITPLHYACEQYPTVRVVKALVEANPSSLRRRQEPGGQLPLHSACTWGASVEAIKVLLAAGPSAAESCDFLSNLPLHCACYSGADLGVIEALVKAYPQSIWPRNHQGSSAADIVKRLNHGNRREVLAFFESARNGLLLEKEEDADEEGLEIDEDNGLMWV